MASLPGARKHPLNDAIKGCTALFYIDSASSGATEAYSELQRQDQTTELQPRSLKKVF
jgi:hypothetical protein